MATLIEFAASFAMNPQMAETGARLIESLLGEPCKVAGGMIADQIYAWRWKNRIRIATRANQILEESGVAAKVLPTGFLVPLLDAAGDVEDETLQQMWARLLASGVQNSSNQHPAFIQILSALSTDEVRILQQLLKCEGAMNLPFRGIGISTMEGVPPLSATVDWEHANEQFDGIVGDYHILPILFDRLQSQGLIGSLFTQRAVFLTPWGDKFLSACMSPHPQLCTKKQNFWV